jgi:hypothetical protein
MAWSIQAHVERPLEMAAFSLLTYVEDAEDQKSHVQDLAITDRLASNEDAVRRRVVDASLVLYRTQLVTACIDLNSTSGLSVAICWSSSGIGGAFKARALGSSPGRLTTLYNRQNL